MFSETPSSPSAPASSPATSTSAQPRFGARWSSRRCRSTRPGTPTMAPTVVGPSAAGGGAPGDGPDGREPFRGGGGERLLRERGERLERALGPFRAIVDRRRGAEADRPAEVDGAGREMPLPDLEAEAHDRVPRDLDAARRPPHGARMD